ncbi:hypothetical protein V6N12_060144 [Hibiscus sabdariffa]|uniref:Uncharacterized protein n=1 Tax=Hibiscus sabdariffa TaxID=183260 RepID=A0ABR2D3K9_9ROSI
MLTIYKKSEIILKPLIELSHEGVADFVELGSERDSYRVTIQQVPTGLNSQLIIPIGFCSCPTLRGDVSALDIECNGNLEPLVASLAAPSPLYTLIREEEVSDRIDACVSERVLDDAKSMGLLNENFEANCELVSYSNKELSWKESVDLANSFHKPRLLVPDDEAEHQSFFPELKDHFSQEKIRILIGNAR